MPMPTFTPFLVSQCKINKNEGTSDSQKSLCKCYVIRTSYNFSARNHDFTRLQLTLTCSKE